MSQLKLSDHFKKTKGSSSSFDRKINDPKTSIVKEEDDQVTGVHDETKSGQDNEITLLKEFDLTCEYGPCLGMSRLDRWNRAKKLGLEPPHCVYTILQRHSDDPIYTECLWRDEKGLVP